jgi:hypothetical protein
MDEPDEGRMPLFNEMTNFTVLRVFYLNGELIVNLYFRMI